LNKTCYRYGNRWHQYQNGAPQWTQSFSGANNRMDGWSGARPERSRRDAAGNLLNDGIHSYQYDAENRLISADGGTTASYVYDAAGRRVRRVWGGTIFEYLYDLSGRAITVMDGNGGWNRGEVFAGSRHLATYANSTTYFAHQDWLGSERVRTNVSGGVVESFAYLPFGDPVGTQGVSPMHFTGDERDSESGLDHTQFRQYASSQGRWLTPDPLGLASFDLSNPQSLNLYAYVVNNPVNLLDPLGLCTQDNQGYCIMDYTWVQVIGSIGGGSLFGSGGGLFGGGVDNPGFLIFRGGGGGGGGGGGAGGLSRRSRRRSRQLRPAALVDSEGA